ncbi:hypothetical protein [Neptuniibacter sp. QD37_11]|uniref:hypothetical protein n=1 Tax=Neptuniibacter sp. QD37_11 TaxID=3398209 RepID=UPI0039F49585
MSKTYLDRQAKRLNQALLNPSSGVSYAKPEVLGPQILSLGLFPDAKKPADAYNAYRKGSYSDQVKVSSTVQAAICGKQLSGKHGYSRMEAMTVGSFMSSYFVSCALEVEASLLANKDYSAKPLSLKPTKELLERLFHSGGVKGEVPLEVKSFINEHLWHLDLPNHACVIPTIHDESHDSYIKQIMSFPALGLWNMVLVFPKAGNKEVNVGLNFKNQTLSSGPSAFTSDDHLVPHACAGEIVARVIPIMSGLAMYYYAQTENLVGGAIRVTKGGIRNTKGSKSKRPPQGISLFAVRELGVNDSDGSLPTEKQAQENSNAHSHGFKVNGYFRYQAYGPKHSKRRLQYIHSYVKGDKDNIVEKAPLIRVA